MKRTANPHGCDVGVYVDVCVQCDCHVRTCNAARARARVNVEITDHSGTVFTYNLYNDYHAHISYIVTYNYQYIFTSFSDDA